MMNPSERALADIERVAEAMCSANSHPRVWASLGPASRAYWRRMAIAAIDALGLSEEVNENVPISVLEFDAHGDPIMCPHHHPGEQKRHFEWITQRRLISPWQEIGKRETSQELSARLEAKGEA